MYVVERLIDTVVHLDYPKSKLQIQILDDSTDETLQISQKKARQYQQQGYDIAVLHRSDRSGYKAGALQNAIKYAKGEFIAIFDADFIPKPDFLHQTLPHFFNPKVGMVQTRWEYINKNHSLLTRIHAMFLDVHFSVEQAGRNASGYFVNFNGTAGVWRSSTIADAGGWQADTLTEDLDLSYRAQLKGWQFKYLENVGSPSELPPDMPSFKSQQFRWIKGGAETAKKILPQISRSSLPFSIKLNAFFHLLSSSIYIVVFFMAIMSVPLLLVKNQFIQGDYEKWGILFLISNFAIAYVYYTSAKARNGNKPPPLHKFLLLLPAFLCITLGLSLHNAMAALRGFAGEKTPFVRTPKFNIKSLDDAWRSKKYAAKKIKPSILLEGLAALYFLAAILYGLYNNIWDLIPFHLFAFLGFLVTFLHSIKHLRGVQTP